MQFFQSPAGFNFLLDFRACVLEIGSMLLKELVGIDSIAKAKQSLHLPLRELAGTVTLQRNRLQGVARSSSAMSSGSSTATCMVPLGYSFAPHFPAGWNRLRQP